MKEKYIRAEIEIISYKSTDIITDSDPVTKDEFEGGGY